MPAYRRPRRTSRPVNAAASSTIQRIGRSASPDRLGVAARPADRRARRVDVGHRGRRRRPSRASPGPCTRRGAGPRAPRPTSVRAATCVPQPRQHRRVLREEPDLARLGRAQLEGQRRRSRSATAGAPRRRRSSRGRGRSAGRPSRQASGSRARPERRRQRPVDHPGRRTVRAAPPPPTSSRRWPSARQGAVPGATSWYRSGRAADSARPTGP